MGKRRVIAETGGSKILGGFGIRTSAQARAVAPFVHAVVAGSVFVDAISDTIAAYSIDGSPISTARHAMRDEAIRRAVLIKASEIVAG